MGTWAWRPLSEADGEEKCDSGKSYNERDDALTGVALLLADTRRSRAARPCPSRLHVFMCDKPDAAYCGLRVSAVAISTYTSTARRSSDTSQYSSAV